MSNSLNKTIEVHTSKWMFLIQAAISLGALLTILVFLSVDFYVLLLLLIILNVIWLAPTPLHQLGNTVVKLTINTSLDWQIHFKSGDVSAAQLSDDSYISKHFLLLKLKNTETKQTHKIALMKDSVSEKAWNELQFCLNCAKSEPIRTN